MSIDQQKQKDLKLTALYCRVSTTEQAQEGFSLETQVDKLTAYTRFQGWQDIEIFLDDGVSASTMRRPELQRLIALIKQGKVARVLTLAVDRLSRNLLDLLQFVELCEQHDTAYVCAALNFDTSTPIGRMVLQILAAFAEFERAMISTRVKDTMAEIAQKKKRYLAVPPFGYEFDTDKNLVIVPEQADWLSKAADMFITGYGYRAVAQFLNEAGVKTRKGKEWESSSVRQTLTNELYNGKIIWGRRYYDKAGKMKWRPEEEWIVHENAHPPIFTDEQWTEINKRIERKVPRGGQRQYKYRLSGLMACADCGSKMVSRSYGSKGPHKDKKIFVCSAYQKKASCRFNYIFTEEANAQVRAYLEDMGRGLKIEDLDIEGPASREKEFARREAAIDTKFQRQIAAYENDLISETDLRLARQRVEKERDLLREQKERLAPDSERMKDALKRQARHILWLWDGDLPLLQNNLRLLFGSLAVRDGEILDFEILLHP